ncbi:MAG: hypothetical protein WDM92_14825 [Caulobacteraceae bacterium]
MRPALVVLACLCLGACASAREKPLNPVTMDHPEKEGVVGAAEAPLEDVNVIRTKIPPYCCGPRTRPYARPDPPTCRVIASDVTELDDVLGDDYDLPPPAPDANNSERQGRVAGETAVGVLRDTAQDFIPLRSWVRRMSGAQRRDNQVRAAVYAGRVRRAYLKGLGEALGCHAPAAPYNASPLPVRPAPRRR